MRAVDEVLACDDRLVAFTMTWRGSGADGGGELALPIGNVYVVEGGRVAHLDQYDPDDRRAMIARYAELGGGSDPSATTPEHNRTD
jgi:hypothetical protein